MRPDGSDTIDDGVVALIGRLHCVTAGNVLRARRLSSPSQQPLGRAPDEPQGIGLAVRLALYLSRPRSGPDGP
jgi:hypothetical protein